MNQHVLIEHREPSSAGDKIGVMLCGHGSRAKSAVAEFAQLAEALKPKLAPWPVAHGYLEFANPVIRDGLDTLRAAGATRILAVPGMLFAAGHAKNDIPTVLNTYGVKNGLSIDYGRELGVDARMLRAAGDRVAAAMAAMDAEHGPVPAAETALVVVGRGASDPDANGNVAKIGRMLWEGFGFGWSQVAYSGVTFPLVEPCLERVATLGFRRIVVFPYFLFSGILIDRIYGFTDATAARFPAIQFGKAGYLGLHEEVLNTFVERATEILEGKAVMNCGLCKYRTQVLGFEAEVGAAQESHHHHVEGMGASAPGSAVETCDLCAAFCSGACRVLTAAGDHHHHSEGHGHSGHHHHQEHSHHSHGHGHGHGHGHDDGGHHHAPYPHAAHPLGPVSVVRSDVLTYERDPAKITQKSFETIRAETDLAHFGGEAGIAERMIHAAGDTGIVSDIVIEGSLSEAVSTALADGSPVVVDSEMTHHAILRRAVGPERIVCALNTTATAVAAHAAGTTRSALAIRHASASVDGGVVVIGNAPTALFELIALIRKGVLPRAIVAAPVGFIGAAESKSALIAFAPTVPFVTLKGRRGGSAVAGAAFNAAALGRGA